MLINIINRVITVCSLLLIVGFNSTFTHAKYIVDSNHSIVNFSTIKIQYVIEPAVFKRIGGTISDDGDVEIIIDLNSIDTNIAIRDTRIGELFFEVIKFPNAIIRAKIDMEKIKSISYYEKIEMPATLEFHGKTKEIKLNILAAKTYENRLLITSMQPVIVDADDYGIPAENLINLAKTVGGLSLSNKVAVNFVLAFK